MLWIKAFHIIFMVTWFAGLFYLPRLFVYHAMTEDKTISDQFKVMERELLIMMHIGGGLTTLFGVWLLTHFPAQALAGMGWLHVKLTMVVGLWIYHFWCRKLVCDFRDDKNTRSHKWYRWFNEAPSLILIGVVLLAVLRPF